MEMSYSKFVQDSYPELDKYRKHVSTTEHSKKEMMVNMTFIHNWVL